MSQPENPVRARLAVVGSVVGLVSVITAPVWWQAGHEPTRRMSYWGSMVTAASAARSATAGPDGGQASTSNSAPSSASASAWAAGSASLGSAAGSATGETTPWCGTGVPVPVYAPSRYNGPLPGPARGAPAPDLPGQLVAHWTGSAGDVEVRWPADAEAARDTRPVDEQETPFTITKGGPGGARMTGVLRLRDAKAGCRAMRWAIYGSVPPGLAARMGADATGDADVDAMAALITDPETPLVRPGVTRVTAAPAHVLACQGATPPRRSGRVGRAVPKADPRVALKAFLEPADHSTPPVRAGRGYRQLIDRSGRITFGKPFEGPGSAYVALVRMTRRGGGWVVDRWEISGC